MSEKNNPFANPITYGSILFLTLPFDEDVGMCSDGAIKSNISLENFEQDNRKNIFYKCLFQIYPSFINTYKKEALDIKSQYERDQDKISEGKYELDRLKEKLTLEYKFNLEYFEKVKNTPISYIQAVQFLHVASNKFLCCNFQQAEIERANYKLELADIPSEATNFKFIPSYKYQKESEGYIYYGDLTCIAFNSNYLNSVPYIHCSTEELKPISMVVEKESIQKLDKREINVSIETQSHWKIHRFSDAEINPNYFCFGDIVWINHVDHNATLMINQKNNNALEVNFVNTVIEDRFQHYIGNTNGMWMIENEGYKLGGNIQLEDRVRLRHFTLGQYLSVIVDEKEKTCRIGLTSVRNANSLFRFVVTETGGQNGPKYFKKEAFVRIQNDISGLWLNAEVNEDKIKTLLLKDPSKNDIFKLFEADSNETSVTNFLVSCFPILKKYLNYIEENLPERLTQSSVFDFYKAQRRIREVQKCLIDLGLFCTNKLLIMSSDYKYGETNFFRQKVLREQHFLELLARILKSSFSQAQYDGYSKEMASPAYSGKQIDLQNPKLQRLFILEEKAKVCKLIYKLFADICRDNTENENYLFKLIPQFQHHVGYFDEAVDCIIQIISRNETLLTKIGESIDLKKIDSDKVVPKTKDSNFKRYLEISDIKNNSEKIIKNESKSNTLLLYILALIQDAPPIARNKKYLKFLRAICTCKGKSVRINQELLFKIFRTYDQIKTNTFFETRLNEKDQLYIGLTDYNLFSLRNCFQGEGILSYHEPEVIYFQEQLGFCSDLLMGRNYLWKAAFQNFPMKFLFEQISNHELSADIRAAFCDLASTLYIDHEPLNPKVVPNLCRVFGGVASDEELGEYFSTGLSSERTRQHIDVEAFTLLLESILKIISDEQNKITSALIENFNQADLNNVEQIKLSGFLENKLLLKVIKLLSNILRFDLITILGKKSLYIQIVYELIHMLEYEKSQPVLSYALLKQRDRKLSEQDNNAKVAKQKGLNDMANIMGVFSKNFVFTMKDLANNIFEGQKKKVSKSKGGSSSEADDHSFLNNPITQGLIQLKHQLDQIAGYDGWKDRTHEGAIKEEICDLLDYMLDMRQDFLISNVLSWFKLIVKKAKDDDDYKTASLFEKIINEDILSVLPEIPKTGIRYIDSKFKFQSGVDILQNLTNIMKMNIKEAQLQKQNFINYTNDYSIPDLDSLFISAQKVDDNLAVGVLPSLIMAFYSSKDTNLQSKLLKAITRLFNQKEELMKNLQNLEVIFAKEDIGTYQKLDQWFTELRLISEKSQVWLTRFTSAGQAEEIKQVCKILEDILETLALKEQQSAKYLKTRQSMIRNLKGHTTLVQIIENGIYHFKYIAYDSASLDLKKNTLLRVFSLANDCLTHFCRANNMNRELLSENLKLFLLHLDVNINQISLICEIFKNKVVYDKYGNLLVESILKTINKHGRKAEFLDPLLVKIKYNILYNSFDKILQDCGLSLENQMKIMNQLIPQTMPFQGKELSILYAKKDEYSDKIHFVFAKQLPLDEPYDYHRKLFEIFLLLGQAQGSFDFVYAKLRKALSIPGIIGLLLEPDNLDSLNNAKKKLYNRKTKLSVNYLSLWSVDSRSDTQEEHKIEETENNIIKQEGLSKIKPNLLSLLNILFLKMGDKPADQILEYRMFLGEFIQKEALRLTEIPEDSKLTEEFAHYLFESLLPFFQEYVSKIFLASREIEEESLDGKALVDYSQELYKKLAWLSTGCTLSQMQICKDFLSYYFEEAEINREIPLINPFTKVSLFANQDKREEKPHEMSDINPDLNTPEEVIRWNNFLGQFLTSRKLKDELEKEKLVLSETIWNIKDILPEEYKTMYKLSIERKELIKKLISFLEFGPTNKVEKTTMVSTLKVLTKMMKTAEEEDKLETQNFFDQNGATTMLLSLLSNPERSFMDDELLNELLLFGISLLDEGNKNVQKTIFNFCTLYSKSEVMFETFYSIISKQIEHLHHKATLKEDASFTNEVTVEGQNLKAIIVEGILRLLQLFTEGHYLDLQNYLRYQTNSRNKYNMVEIITELLRTYFSNLVQHNYENIIKCLDTLTEFVQGPCFENQIALIGGKFFEIAVGILTIDPKKSAQISTSDSIEKNVNLAGGIFDLKAKLAQKAKVRDKPLSPWMISRLKYKVLVLITSLLEMRTSDAIVKRIMRSLPVEVLTKNLTQVHKQYKRFYGDSYVTDSLKHFEGDPVTDDEHSSQYYELITEIGFMSYFLIAICIEAHEEVKDMDLKNYTEEVNYDIFVESKSQKNWLTHNLIIDLFRFVYTFIKTNLGYISIGFKNLFPKKKSTEKKRSRIPIQEKEEERLSRKAKNQKKAVKEAMHFFSKNSASIEVTRGGSLEKVYFILMPYCHLIPKDTKEDFHNRVNRQSPQTKVSGLVAQADQIINICKHEMKLKIFFSKNKILSLFANFIGLWEDLTLFLCIVLNFIILLSFSINLVRQQGSNNIESNPRLFLSESISIQTTDRIIKVMGAVIAVCSVFVVLFFLFKHAPFIVSKAWIPPPPGKKISLFKRFLKIMINISRLIFFSLMNIEIIYYCAYGVLALVATAGHPFLFCFHLSQILIKNSTLKSVIQAVWKPRKQLGLTLLLYLIITYFFSLLGFVFFSDDYDGGCDSTIKCFLNTFDFTFKANGGIGGFLDTMNTPARGEYRAGRVLFDFFENILLLIIMINIVLGIIIDTFRSLREKERDREDDIQDKCFVCGLSRSLIDKSTGEYSFNEHIKKDHYMWNYIFYIAYLREKAETEFTGIESLIHNKLKNYDTSWFPFHQALALKHQGENDYGDKQIINLFHSEINELRKNIQDLNIISEAFTENLI